MILLVNKFLVPKTFSGITIFPFVFVNHEKLKKDKVFINHERIHLRQQLELLIIFFFLWYGIEFLFHFLKTKNKKAAYKMISFEREAYENEKDLDYLKKRSWFGFLKF